MTPDDPSQPDAGTPPSPGPSDAQRRGRRPRRGHRGRGRGRKSPPLRESGPAPAALGVQEPPPAHEPVEPFPEPMESEAEFGESAPEVTSVPDEPREPEPPPRPAQPGTVQDAIDNIAHVIKTLREALEEMEDVLELLESLERQGNADQREIESLRHALRQLQRPREGGQHHGRR